MSDEHGNLPAPICRTGPTPDGLTEEDLERMEELDEANDPFLQPLNEDHLGSAQEVHDEEPDTGRLLDRVIDRRTWPGGKNPGGRPREFNIDERIVYAMALVGGTQAEIAAHFGCSQKLIRERFAPLLKLAGAARKIRLRQKQYQVAMEGNPAMLIWLGKQELNQIDESRIRLGDLSRFSDEELAQIAQGKVPGQLTAGQKKEDEDEG